MTIEVDLFSLEKRNDSALKIFLQSTSLVNRISKAEFLFEFISLAIELLHQNV